MKICENLRQSVLQAAIQGKLVEQRPEEGTGEELYQQIQAEKQKLIKAGKFKKEKPLSEITEDEIPFEIPDSWKWVKLGNICSICTGKKDANFGSSIGNYFFFTCAKEPIRCNSFSFSGESILMAGNGDIGNISYYFGEFEAYQRTYVLQPYMEFTYLKYVLYHLSYNWVPYNNDKMFGTAIPYIKLGNVQNYLVALPSLAEQKRIVAKIDELMAKIDDLEKTENELEMLKKDFPEDMKASILQAAMQGKLTERLDSDSNVDELLESIRMEKEQLIKAKKIKREKPFRPISDSEVRLDIPENWRLARFGALVLNYDSKRKPVSAKDRVHGIYNYYGATGAIDKIESYLFDGEFLLIGEDGGNFFVSRDNSFIARGKFWANNHVHVTKPVQINIKFLKYFLDSLNLPAMGLIKGIAVPKLNQGDLNSIVVPIPPVEEQQRIVDKLDELLPLCDTLQEGVE